VPPTATPTVAPSATATALPPTGTATPAPTATNTVEPVVHLAAGGDLMLARTIGDKLVAQGPDIVFAGVQSTLAQADLFVANLECVIAADDLGTPALKSYTFRAPPLAANALAAGGIDLVTLANNHSLDYGIDALADELPHLRALGIETVGAGADDQAARAPVILERNGLKVAFLGYVDVPVEGRTGFDTRSWEAGPASPGLAWAVPANMQFDIASARLKADVVVVMLHFGLEGNSEFTDSQQALAHLAIDSGASLVLGAHSHVLQPVELYNGGLIAYSLGNLVFDGFAPPATSSAIFTATLTRAGVTDYAFVPVMVDHGLPRPATAGEAAFINALVAPVE
jgi:poly-gamma-glutamate synthesis protein (capsule biosynthesis protein)